MEIKDSYGVPPGTAATVPGTGWYHAYHTIQNKSAIHTMLLYWNCVLLATPFYIVSERMGICGLFVYIRGVGVDADRHLVLDFPIKDTGLDDPGAIFFGKQLFCRKAVKSEEETE